MLTIYQTRDFLDHGAHLHKNLGSFFNLKNAEDKLGWYFVHSCCTIVPF